MQKLLKNYLQLTLFTYRCSSNDATSKHNYFLQVIYIKLSKTIG